MSTSLKSGLNPNDKMATKKTTRRPSKLRFGKQLYDLIDVRSYDLASTPAERVKRAKALLEAGAVYVKGCSEFVCDVLGIPWEDANALMGSSPNSIGKNNSYSGASPGDVVGWKVSGGSGHVAIYIGEARQIFIDVPTTNKVPRKLGSGYGAQEVFLSSRKF